MLTRLPRAEFSAQMVHIQLYTSRIACPFRIRIVDFWLGHEINDMAEAYKGIRERELGVLYAEK
jgi:hypothetical protein